MKHILIALLLFPLIFYGQDDLLAELDSEVVEDNNTLAVFKGLKIVNFESTKLVNEKELTLVIAHRFGTVKNGIDTFFGLDDAVTRINFIYGITDFLNVGISRSSYQKIYESSIKLRLLRQKNKGFPVTIVGYGSLMYNSALEEENLPRLEEKHRFSYAGQLIVSSKISKNLSIAVIPTLFHDNLVSVDTQESTQVAIGGGFRYKISKRWSINADYGHHLNRAVESPFKNPLSIGFDLETGGHVFQMHFTNAQPMNVNGFLGKGTGDWENGNIYFGFNLSRVF